MKKTVSDLESHVGYWLRFVSNQTSQAFSAKVENEGVTVAEWVVMRKLFEHSTVNPSQLAKQLVLSRGAVSKLIDRLLAKDLVEKQLGKEVSSNLDGRYQTVGLTLAGRKLVPKLAQLADQNDREFFGHLSTTQRAKLVQILKQIVVSNAWKKMPTE